MQKEYRGRRTDDGAIVTVDGNASSPFNHRLRQVAKRKPQAAFVH